MKKNTIYTLLCTVTMISSVCLAADDEKLDVNKGALKTPLSKIKEKSKELFQTPDKSEFIKNYPSNMFSPDSANFLAEMDRSKVSASNAIAREKEKQKVLALDFQSKMEALAKEEKEKLSILEQEKRQELIKEEKKAQQLAQEIESARLREEEAEENLKKLKSQLEAMVIEADNAKLELEKSAALESEVESLKSQVEVANTLVQSQREQKLAIRKAAEEDIKRKDERLKEIEALVEQRTKELYETKLDRERLRLAQETSKKLQGLKIISEKEPEQKGDSNSQKLPESVIQTSAAVSDPQLQSGVPVSIQLPTSNGDGAQTTASVKPKREVKDVTDTKF